MVTCASVEREGLRAHPPNPDPMNALPKSVAAPGSNGTRTHRTVRDLRATGSSEMISEMTSEMTKTCGMKGTMEIDGGGELSA